VIQQRPSQPAPFRQNPPAQGGKKAHIVDDVRKSPTREPKVVFKEAPGETETGKAPSPDLGMPRQGGGLKKSGGSHNLKRDDEV